ncbi:MAG: DUF1501 domain-containing protein, partial [Planctomycetaceae bacterium]
MTDHNYRSSRRDFFARTGDGLLGAALTQLLCQDYCGGTSVLASEAPTGMGLQPKRTHHEARTRSVIQLFMSGGPSQMDLFDP